MSRLRRSIRLMLILLAGLTAALFLVALGIIAKAEWDASTSVPGQTPKSFKIVSAPVAGASAPVLILLHGAGLNGHMWDPVLRHLDARYRVIALDLPGHGSRRDEEFSLEAAAATVAAAARSVTPASVVLVGDSLGGYAAMAAASSLPPEQLRGMVLAGCSANFDFLRSLKYLKDVVAIRIMGVFIDESTFVSRALASLGMNDQDGRTIIAAGVSVRAVPSSTRNLLNVDFREKLAAIDRPVLIVNGSLDERAMGQEASFKAAARQATSYHFENTPHGVSMRRSPEFATLINDFAAQVFAATEANRP
jgi:pimeloyl-ACP methyl ester carboxylesterase